MRIIRNERGFTFPEILVVTSLILIMVLVSLALLKQKVPTTELLNGQRRTNIAALAQGLQRYKAERGQYPADLPAVATAISSTEGGYPLCRYLVPTFLPDLPTDPDAGSKYYTTTREETSESCDTEGVDYSIGYDIAAQGGVITISAPNAKDETIDITIR